MIEAKEIFAFNKEQNRLFVKAQYCGIPELILITDELPISFFNKETIPYIEASVALEWFKKESKDYPQDNEYKKFILAYQCILEKFNTGKITEVEG